MTEKELGKALLNVDSAGVPGADPLQLTQKILKRDRWSMRLLTGLATFFWILASAGLVVLVSFYLVMVTPRLKAYAAGRAQLENDWNDWAYAVNLAGGSILVCIVTLLLAAVSTMLLILLSRRATLRQINASLAEISEQLKQLRQVH
jgi:hypothetical protein